jgi:hypothetical protein
LKARNADYVKNLKILWANLDELFYVVSRVGHYVSDEECIMFRELLWHFSHLWRHVFKLNVSPKVHVMEDHVPELLEDWRNLGDESEDSAERCHAIENVRGES